MLSWHAQQRQIRAGQHHCWYHRNRRTPCCSLVSSWRDASRANVYRGAQCQAQRGPGVTESDELYMRRALDLAATVTKEQTYPNPQVGCVIVKDGEIVGEGYHPKAGEPHAEVFALRAAGQQAQGATAYVTLEPCNHYGRTPPCAIALIEAQVARVHLRMNNTGTRRMQVVVAVVDPNPQVGGQGIKRLESKGIEVNVSCLEDAAFEINKEFMERIASGA